VRFQNDPAFRVLRADRFNHARIKRIPGLDHLGNRHIVLEPPWLGLGEEIEEDPLPALETPGQVGSGSDELFPSRGVFHTERPSSGQLPRGCLGQLLIWWKRKLTYTLCCSDQSIAALNLSTIAFSLSVSGRPGESGCPWKRGLISSQTPRRSRSRWRR
jgi:hypothetical protein